jgi:hypothetical protein
MERKIVRLGLLGFLCLFFLACEGPVGPSGATGPTVYLTNGSSRVYSGGVIKAGVVDYSTSTGPTLSLDLHNETGAPLSVSSVNGFRVQPTDGYIYYAPSFSYYYWASPDNAANYYPYQLGEVFLSGDLSSASIPDGASLPFSIAFNPADSNVYYKSRGESHQSYKIGLTDSVGTSYDFVFEVYGVVAC